MNIDNIIQEYNFDSTNTTQIDALKSIINKDDIFLTGEGGSGKSTFIKKIITMFNDMDITYDVVTFTGVATTNFTNDNISASTIHSYCKLGTQNMSDRKFNLSDMAKIENTDVLIIDEISMVSAEIFDRMSYRISNAIHRISKNTQKGMSNSYLESNHFGNKQIILIGDMLQLAPIVSKHDNYSQKGYDTPYFFSSKTFQTFGNDYKFFNFTKNYRQNESDLLECFRAIRYGLHTPEHLNFLNETCYSPNHVDSMYHDLVNNDGLFLTSLRKTVDRVNDYCYNMISTSDDVTLTANMKGNRFANKPPVAIELSLKKNVKVLTVVNNREAGYINGTSFFVENVNDNGTIVLRFAKNNEYVVIEPYLWYNMTDSEQQRYDRNFNSGGIPATKSEINAWVKHNVSNWFEQYPLIVGWAMTIHKSQGMTLDNAYIDTHDSFGFGQTYVALSRVTSKQSLKLVKPVTSSQIKCDYRILDFYAKYEIV